MSTLSEVKRQKEVIDGIISEILHESHDHVIATLRMIIEVS